MAQAERESMEVDILYVGAGPATLASALHLVQQVERHNRSAAAQRPRRDRDAEHPGAREGRQRRRPHALRRRDESEGDPRAGSGLRAAGLPDRVRLRLRRLLALPSEGQAERPLRAAELPQEGLPRRLALQRGQVAGRRARRPPASRSTRASRPTSILVEGDRVVGVRTGDMGVDRDGQPEGELPAGHGHLREGHRDRRGRARHAREAADRALRPARGATRRPSRPASRRSGASTRRSTGPAASCTAWRSPRS